MKKARKLRALLLGQLQLDSVKFFDAISYGGNHACEILVVLHDSPDKCCQLVCLAQVSELGKHLYLAEVFFD